MSKLSDFGKFLSKYAVEAAALASGLRVVISGVAVGSQDRDELAKVIERFETTAKNVANAATTFKEVKVTPRKADIEAAVSALLPDAIRAELIKAGLISESEAAEKTGE